MLNPLKNGAKQAINTVEEGKSDMIFGIWLVILSG